MGMAYEELKQNLEAIKSYYQYLKLKPEAEDAIKIRKKIERLESQ